MNPKYRLAFALGIAQLVALAAASRHGTHPGGHRRGPGGRRPACGDRGRGPGRHPGGPADPPGPSRFRERLEAWHGEQHAGEATDRPDGGDDAATT